MALPPAQRRKKQVILPIHSELLFLLDAEYEPRESQSSDPVLINPATGKPLTRPRLYQRMPLLVDVLVCRMLIRTGSETR